MPGWASLRTFKAMPNGNGHAASKAVVAQTVVATCKFDKLLCSAARLFFGVWGWGLFYDLMASHVARAWPGDDCPPVWGPGW